MAMKQKVFFYIDEEQNVWGYIYEQDPHKCRHELIDWRRLIGATIKDIKTTEEGRKIFIVELADTQ
jgi:hypothetical protein